MLRLYKIINVVLFFFKFGNIRFAYYLAKHQFPTELANEVSVRGGKLLVKKTGQSFSIQQLSHCEKSLSLFMKVATHPEVKIDNSKADTLTMICGNTIIKGDSFDNFYLVQEIFMDGVYNFFMKDKEVAVIDVGMNVGLASLFFAGKPYVTKVYSFEPFPSTYQRALENLELNPSLKQKIVPHNAGVDGADAVLKIPVVVGESALGTTSDFLMEHLEVDQKKTVTVQIKDIKTILREVFKAHETLPIILKLDCEGAEYEIMRQMDETGLIKRISVIVIEWHMKGFQSLNDILVKNDFSTTVFPRPNAVMYDIGLVYAVNTKR